MEPSIEELIERFTIAADRAGPIFEEVGRRLMAEPKPSRDREPYRTTRPRRAADPRD